MPRLSRNVSRHTGDASAFPLLSDGDGLGHFDAIAGEQAAIGKGLDPATARRVALQASALLGLAPF